MRILVRLGTNTYERYPSQSLMDRNDLASTYYLFDLHTPIVQTQDWSTFHTLQRNALFVMSQGEHETYCEDKIVIFGVPH